MILLASAFSVSKSVDIVRYQCHMSGQKSTGVPVSQYSTELSFFEDEPRLSISRDNGRETVQVPSRWVDTVLVRLAQAGPREKLDTLQRWFSRCRHEDWPTEKVG